MSQSINAIVESLDRLCMVDKVFGTHNVGCQPCFTLTQLHHHQNTQCVIICLACLSQEPTKSLTWVSYEMIRPLYQKPNKQKAAPKGDPCSLPQCWLLTGSTATYGYVGERRNPPRPCSTSLLLLRTPPALDRLSEGVGLVDAHPAPGGLLALLT